MLNTSSFKAYARVDETERAQLAARLKTRRQILLISLSSVALVAIIVAAVVGTSRGTNFKDDKYRQSNSLSTSIKAVCDVTLYKDSCYKSLSPVANSTHLSPDQLFKLSAQVAAAELSKAANNFFPNGTNHNSQGATTVDKRMSAKALDNCRELLGLALEHIESCLSSGNLLEAADDIRTWLSAAGTYQQTCIDGLEEVKKELRDVAQACLTNPIQLTSNSLAIVSWISEVASTLNLRRLLTTSPARTPQWMHPKDRKLLQSSVDLKKKADFVVAKDGSGKFKSISAALEAVPDKSDKTTVIYVKKGVYLENVRIEKTKWNVLMIGDGMDSTVVSSDFNFVDGTPTFSTATFAVFGKGFVGRDMGFLNTAGPSKHQAVALMSLADQSVFYRCKFDAFQDTLYAHSNCQFYRECSIYGTVDFIFGNSAVVFQNCNILPKRPMPGQQNTITAQGKVDPNQNTGISIQNCTLWPYGNLSSVKTFLGRPWKNYSTTVYMQSMFGSLIDPQGWLPWEGSTAPDTIFYAEFQNFGPSASNEKRVNWKGLRAITSKEAKKFTVEAFLHGEKWIPSAAAPYKSSL